MAEEKRTGWKELALMFGIGAAVCSPFWALSYFTSKPQIEPLPPEVRQYDANRDGVLDANEFRAYQKDHPQKPAEASETSENR